MKLLPGWSDPWLLVVKTYNLRSFTYYFSSGYTCPTCNESLVDMSSSWERLDSTIAQTPMPPEYANIDVRVSEKLAFS